MSALAYRARVRARLPARARRGSPFPSARGRAAIGAVAGAVLVATSTSGVRALAGLPLGAWLGARVAGALAGRERLRAIEEARAALPGLIDRLATCVLAGMSVEQGLATVGSRAPRLIKDAIHAGRRALDAGTARARAYALIGERSGIEEMRALLVVLARAERFGTPVSEVLVAQARELRSRARARAETEARTAPVRMLFPLVLCFLPAFVLLTIAPIALSAIRTLGGI
ncbi:MAG TPA: type II secretion system F family protein [Actinomycetota bacterium]